VLNRLHDITSEKNPINVLGANRFCFRLGDWRRIELGKNVFVHRSAPRGWLEEWSEIVARGQPMGLLTARNCLAPFTFTELWQILEPVGIDRWPFELAMKHGMRDGYICPAGGRWVVAFWSPRLLGHSFTPQARGLLYMAAGAAAVRLERLVGNDVKRVRSSLTSRERAVLRHASAGLAVEEIAETLHLGGETVRSHFKKAQAKLGTRNRIHTVAEAMRDLLIV
jgi:LuxR family quorum sensing-dependent transcriptional regulator